MDNEEVYQELAALVALIKKLRAPNGCPWDKQQKKEDIGKYLLAEAYEVIDELAEADSQGLKEELGDLLFQILFLAEMADEAGDFSLTDVLTGIREKMIRRHPHVFGDVKVSSTEEVKENWQKIKARERESKNREKKIFDGIPRSLPALLRAQKITGEAAQYHFDWETTNEVIDKLNEELGEFIAARQSNNQSLIKEELGDILFTVVNLSRFVNVDAETALSQTTNKFVRRFSAIMATLAARGIKPGETGLKEMDALWNEIKKKEAKAK